MPYPRIYIASDLTGATSAKLDSAQQHRLSKVLRLRAGARLRVFDQSGHEYEAQLQSTQAFTLLGAVAEQRESPLRVSVGQAWARGERMDYAVQKCTELGVSCFAPLLSDRSVHYRSQAAERKVEHLGKIALHAAEQSWRQRVPEIKAASQLTSWVQQCSAPIKLVMDENSSAPLADLLALEGSEQNDAITTMPLGPGFTHIALLVGPEGGLSAMENTAAEQCGFKRWRLGPRVLRTETAAASALAVLQYLYGDLNCQVKN